MKRGQACLCSREPGVLTFLCRCCAQVKYRADVHAMDSFMHETAIHHAATGGFADCIRMLLSHAKRWMDDVNSRGETALHLAAAGGHFDCVKMLLLMGNTPEWKHEFINRKDTRQEDTALHKACEYGHTRTARMLIDQGAVVHSFNVLARTPLHYAAANSDPELVTFLLRAGANHLATDCDGRRPIQHVVNDSVRNAFEAVTAGPRERMEHISLARLEIVSERRNAWRREEQIRESGSDEHTVRVPAPPLTQSECPPTPFHPSRLDGWQPEMIAFSSILCHHPILPLVPQCASPLFSTLSGKRAMERTTHVCSVRLHLCPCDSMSSDFQA